MSTYPSKTRRQRAKASRFSTIRNRALAAKQATSLSNVAPRNYRIKRAWPLWTPWAMAAVVLTVAYAIYSIRLNTITQQVLVSLERILNL